MHLVAATTVAATVVSLRTPVANHTTVLAHPRVAVKVRLPRWARCGAGHVSDHGLSEQRRVSLREGVLRLESACGRLEGGLSAGRVGLADDVALRLAGSADEVESGEAALGVFLGAADELAGGLHPGEEAARLLILARLPALVNGPLLRLGVAPVEVLQLDGLDGRTITHTILVSCVGAAHVAAPGGADEPLVGADAPHLPALQVARALVRLEHHIMAANDVPTYVLTIRQTLDAIAPATCNGLAIEVDPRPRALDLVRGRLADLRRLGNVDLLLHALGVVLGVGLADVSACDADDLAVLIVGCEAGGQVDPLVDMGWRGEVGRLRHTRPVAGQGAVAADQGTRRGVLRRDESAFA
mmetsp:Transcript_17823/g.42842  ORF Transcript_17823/g.42842 Transcript_17823/m.42842 type:complete len:356 (-) Transcript_17823:3928-4995(-)